MRYVVLIAASAVLGAAPASALTIINFAPRSGVLPDNLFVFQDFETFAPGAPGAPLGIGSFVFNKTMRHQGTRPTVGSTGNFGAVQSGGSYTVHFERTTSFGLVLSTLDGFNSLTLLYDDGSSQTYAGGQIIHGLAFADNDRVRGRDNGFVTYTVTRGPLLVGATFRSSGNAFEFDNLATAAMPEPASWGMLIGGFALIGGSLRRRRTKAFAA